MPEILIVLQREFGVRVRSRSYLLSTILTPVFLSFILLFPLLSRSWQPDSGYRVAVVDGSAAGIGARAATQLSAAPEANLLVSLVMAPLTTVSDSLNRQIQLGRIDGYLWVPHDILSGRRAELRLRDETNGILPSLLTSAVSDAVRSVRLRQLRLSPEELALLLEPVDLQVTRLSGTIPDEQSSEAGLLFSSLLGMALYFVILLYGVQVLHSVQEEKQNRIAEVLVSSIRAPQLMIGKVLGVGLAALLQVAVWSLWLWAVASQRERVTDFLGAPPELLELLSLRVAPGLATVMVLYTVLGFLLYASLFAAAGAAAASTDDAQRFTMPLVMPLFIPIILIDFIVTQPSHALVVVLAWLPLTSPLVMPMRIGAGGAAPTEIVGALAFLALSVYLLGVLAGKIYRVGILSTGRRPSARELLRWMRTA